MDEFDYLDGTLLDWVEQFSPAPEPGQPRVFVSFEEIQNEYLPRFEEALHKNASRHTVLK